MPQPSQHFAQKMREARKEMRLTQVDMATQVSHDIGRSIDGTAITRIEKAQRSVSLDEAVAIARTLHLPLEKMLPTEFTAEEEIANLEEERARLHIELVSMDYRRTEISDSLNSIETRLAELTGATE